MAVFVLCVAIAFVVTRGNNSGTLAIIYSGTATNGSNSVCFIITNATRDVMEGRIELKAATNAAKDNVVRTSSGDAPSAASFNTVVLVPWMSVDDFSGSNLFVDPPTLDQWRLEAFYTSCSTQLVYGTVRWKTAHWMQNHMSTRVGNWIAGIKDNQRAYGPWMLGNKPAEPPRK
jgi:hypothetical protein